MPSSWKRDRGTRAGWCLGWRRAGANGHHQGLQPGHRDGRSRHIRKRRVRVKRREGSPGESLGTRSLSFSLHLLRRSSRSSTPAPPPSAPVLSLPLRPADCAKQPLDSVLHLLPYHVADHSDQTPSSRHQGPPCSKPEPISQSLVGCLALARYSSHIAQSTQRREQQV